jgi:hypothetical protein
MVKRSAAHFDFDDPLPSSDEDVHPPPSVRIRHTNISFGEDGQSSGCTQHFHGPASPRKQSSTAHIPEPTWIQDAPPMGIDPSEYPWMDPAYEHHLDFNEPGPPKRKRTASVSQFML